MNLANHLDAGVNEASAADLAEPFLHALLGAAPPVDVHFWDGSKLESNAPIKGALTLRSPEAFRRIIWAPGELGLARAFVAGDLDFDGDLFELLAALRDVTGVHLKFSPKALTSALAAARQLGALGVPLPPPAEESPSILRHRWQRLHSKGRDSQAISHHYDVGNEFYQLVLGPSMTYSCARYTDPHTTLAEAQHAKHELICRKLGLADQSGQRLLDVGCGWGSLAIHAAREHKADVTAITISQEQAALARQRIREEGLADKVEIRLQDYRELSGETFDAISSVGMFEHVGSSRIGTYFDQLRPLLKPTGRMLNHAISSIGGSELGPRTFVGRYVFPDGELIDVGEVVLAMERAGFEVRDVESLREHYARTLRDWVANLEANWTQAVALVGEGRARVWRLYMAGSAVGFEDGGLGLHQVLGVVPSADGASGMPPTMRDWS